MYLHNHTDNLEPSGESVVDSNKQGQQDAG
jgi:hypothetical protein